MAEKKSQARSIPLRVRLRASNKAIATLGDSLRRTEPIVLGLSDVLGTGRYTQQIRVLVTLGKLLRTDLGMDEVLRQVVASAAACTGFHLLVVRLLDQETKQLTAVAFNSTPEEPLDVLGAAPVSWETLQQLMQPEFRLGQSYFVSHESIDRCVGKLPLLSQLANEDVKGTWHPNDLFFVPFYSPREQKLLGTISFDDPVDGKVPTVESSEMAELFVSIAATAIDNVLLLQEREEERLALKGAISTLCTDVEALQKGDFCHPLCAQHPLLEPVVNGINAVVGEAGDVLDSMYKVARAVDEHVANVQSNTEKLLLTVKRQELQVKHITQIMSDIAHTMHHITESAAILTRTAVEAVEAAVDAQNTLDCTVRGIVEVHDATMHSARTMKGLIESSQEIKGVVLAPTELTTRLHVLALNAAIEATRIGEQGSGFALIAQELRSLAMSSKEAARKIEEFIRSTQHETSVVSQSIEESAQNVIMQTELVTRASMALDAINGITEQLPSLVQNICVVAENQSQGSQMAANALDEIFCTKAEITGHIQEMQQSVTQLAELTNVLRSHLTLPRSQEP